MIDKYRKSNNLYSKIEDGRGRGGVGGKGEGERKRMRINLAPS